MGIGRKLYEEASNHAPETVDAVAVVMAFFEEWVMDEDPDRNERFKWVADGFTGAMASAAERRHHLSLFDSNGEPRPGTALALTRSS